MNPRLALMGVGFVLFSGLLVLIWAGSGSDVPPPATEAEEAALAPEAEEVALTYPEELPTGQLPEGVTPLGYTLDLTLLPEEEGFSGKVTIEIETDRPLKHIFLHSEGLDVSRVETFQGSNYLGVGRFEEEGKDGASRLRLPFEFKPGRYFLVFDYSAAYSQELDGIYKVTEDGLSYLTTQMQTISARRAMPSFDEPRFKTPFSVSITAPAGDAAVANTPLLSSVPVAEGLVRHEFAISEPLPTYLLAFAVGPYDIKEWAPIAPNGDRAHAIPLRAVVTKGNGERAARLLETTERIVHYFEDYFDEPYPYAKLDLIGVPDFAFGAMENAGAIVYREQYILLSDTIPEYTFAWAINTHAHEIAHQWFGDLVTPYWWDDAWLNESFASWAATKGADAAFPGRGYDLETRKDGMSVFAKDYRKSVRPVRLPIQSTHDIVNAFDCREGDAGFTARQSRFAPLAAGQMDQRVWQVPICYRTEAGSDCVLLKEEEARFSLGGQCPAYFMPNADGHGYYHWSLKGGDLEKLLNSFGDLTSMEGASVAANLKAWIESGEVQIEDALNVARALSQSEDPAIAEAPIDSLLKIYGAATTPEQELALQALFKEFYGGHMDRLGLMPNEVDEAYPSSAGLLREAVAELMAYHVRDADLRAELAEMGAAVVAGKNDKVNSDLRFLALAVAVE